MPHKLTFLNEKQLDVLGWIGDGCPPRDWPDYAHRITARALAQRGLVSVRGSGNSWRAKITETGQRRLDDLLRVGDRADRVQIEADELLTKILESTDSAFLEGEFHYRSAEFTNALMTSQLRPRGKQAVCVPLGPWGAPPFRWQLIEYVPEQIPVRAVTVVDTLDRRDPVVRSFRANKEWLGVTAELIDRASLLIQTIHVESARRGYEVSIDDRNFLSVSIGEDRFSLRLREISRAGGAWIPYEKRRRLPPWQGARQTEFVPSGRIRIDAADEDFRDHGKSPIENQLGAVFHALEVKGRQAQRRRERERERLAELAVQWHEEMNKAEARLQREHTLSTLRDQMRAWNEAEELRHYADAVEAHSNSAEDQPAAWAHAIRAIADELDPTRAIENLRTPPPRDFGPSDLKAYLRPGFDPDGPPSDVLLQWWE